MNMASTNTLYETLGIKKDASEAEIKKAYRSMSLVHHPDRGGDAEKFKDVSQAYETLSDPQKRRCYDAEITGFGGFGGATGFGPFFGSGEASGIQHIFQNMFHMGNAGPGIHVFHAEQFAEHPFFANFVKPQLIHSEIALDLEQVLTGGTVSITFDRFIVRPDNSKTNERKTVEVRLEAGIEDEESIVLPGIGNVVQGITGDVKVTVHVVPHAHFTREGLDLHYTHVIPLVDALCGFHFDLTLLSKQNITIKNVKHPVKIVYPDMEQVCPGHGLVRDGKTGNLVIHFKVLFPETLTEEEQLQLKAILL